ncbi:MAG: hypothetical protein PF436_05470 [Prolixibacteraceae bacterium]|jgi:hypothetical protein|nr:hypothetical protein [Prolixibacteraceae bacterium]
MKTIKEKKLEVALLKEKLERISGKKITFKEGIEKISDPVLVKLIAYEPNSKETIKVQGASLKTLNNFLEKMKKFKNSLPKVDYEYTIEIRVIKDRIGTLSSEQKEFLQTIAWNTGDHYELFY